MFLIVSIFAVTSAITSYRADIDGLRAIAVLAVVIYHAFPAALPGGFIGVDVFFVISGYLITRIIEGGLTRGDFSFSDFYARRIRRIFPALIVVVAACLVAGWALLLPGELRLLGGHTVATAGFLANFAFWNDTGYFDGVAETKPLLHLWSLGIEEQFYLLWPLLLWAAWRCKWPLWMIAAATAALSLGANLLSIGRWPELTFYFPHTRAWELTGGALLALCPWKLRRLLCGNIAAWLGLGLLVAGFALIRPSYAFPGAWALLPVLGAMLVIGAGDRSWLNRHLLAHRTMVFLGLISYPLYLWHWPLLSFLYMMEGGGMPSPILRATAVLLALALAALTWRWVEMPLRHRGPSRGRVRLLVGLMLIIATLGAGLWANQGAPGRFRGGVLMDEASIERERLAYWAQGDWRRNYDEGRPKVITFGDSQGFDVFRALALDTSLGVHHFESRNSCTAFRLPMRGKEDGAALCRETYGRLFESDDLRKADVFIYAHSWWRENEQDNTLENYRQALAELRAVNPRMRVVFMGPKPFLGKHWVSVNTLVRDQKTLGGLNDFLNGIRWRREEDIDHARKLAEDLGVMFVDIDAVYCLEGCNFFEDGEFAYFDQNHWTGLGARSFRAKMLRSGEWARIFDGFE